MIKKLFNKNQFVFLNFEMCNLRLQNKLEAAVRKQNEFSSRFVLRYTRCSN